MTNVTLSSENARPDVLVFDREREKSHRQMISSVAHDLKTPLASVIGSLEVYTLMQQKLSAEKQAELIRVALQEAHRLDTFIANILDMAKLEGGDVKPKPEDFEVGGMLAGCVSRRSAYLPQGALRLLNTQALKVTTDAALLSRVVGWVLDNAIQFGGAPLLVAIDYGEGEGKTGNIHIHDNGAGIAAGQLDAIFSKYARLRRDGSSSNTSGLGLGLALARETMRLLQGNIEATNHPEGGAVFTICFPLRA